MNPYLSVPVQESSSPILYTPPQYNTITYEFDESVPITTVPSPILYTPPQYNTITYEFDESVPITTIPSPILYKPPPQYNTITYEFDESVPITTVPSPIINNGDISNLYISIQDYLDILNLLYDKTKDTFISVNTILENMKPFIYKKTTN
jgi:hypothetical protein